LLREERDKEQSWEHEESEEERSEISSLIEERV
jgi:hypothetical protein